MFQANLSSIFTLFVDKANNIHNILSIYLLTGLSPDPNTVVIAQKKKYVLFACVKNVVCFRVKMNEFSELLWGTEN